MGSELLDAFDDWGVLLFQCIKICMAHFSCVSGADCFVVMVCGALVHASREPAHELQHLYEFAEQLLPMVLVGAAQPLGAKCWITIGSTVASAICTTCGETPAFSTSFFNEAGARETLADLLGLVAVAAWPVPHAPTCSAMPLLARKHQEHPGCPRDVG